MFEYSSRSLIVSIVFGTLLVQVNAQLRGIYSWKSLDFDFPSLDDRNRAINSGDFIPGGLMPLDVDVYSKGNNPLGARVFVTVPRFQNGVPVTLGYVTNKTNSAGDPLIAPFPNWEMQTPGGDCFGITSVYRVAIDSCDRLWVLDTGKLGSDQVCPPQILVYSLITNNILSRHWFPETVYSSASLFATPIIDIRGSCNDPYVYIADPNDFSLYVFDYRNSRSWRILNDVFNPDPNFGTFNINGESFNLTDGIFGLTLGPIRPDGDRMLYFHSLASRTEAFVPTSVIRDGATFANNSRPSPQSFQSFPNPRSSQAAAEVMDRNGVLFYGLINDVAIGCWNSRDFPQFGGDNVDVAVANRETLQFASGMKVITPGQDNREELWVMTVSFQKIMNGSLRPNETNFRIQAAYTDDLVRGTRCGISTPQPDPNPQCFGKKKSTKFPQILEKFLIKMKKHAKK